MKNETRQSLKQITQKLGFYGLYSELSSTAKRYRAKRDCIKEYKTALRDYPISKRLYILPFFLYDHETTNFTYDIENREELMEFLSTALAVEPRIVKGYISELDDDIEMKDKLRQKLRTRKDRNPEPRYGRRLGWYCIARMRRPQLIVETGTRDGLGAAVLVRALQRNREEGYPGRLLTFDIDPESGWLLDPAAAEYFQIIIQDTRTALVEYLSGRCVDFFVHDSNHSYDHELFELNTIARYASDQAVLVSDNAHAGDAMRDFCSARQLPFYFFKEKPKRHFYPGAGIGLSFWTSATS